MTPRELAMVAQRVFREGPVLVRTLQHWRPYICPFEELLRFVPEEARVLDIGCGGGLFGALVCACRKPGRYVGFDSSRDAIAMAQANVGRFASGVGGGSGGGVGGGDGGGGGIAPEFLRLDVGEPWPAGPFDVAAMIDVIHHIPPEHQRGALVQAASAVEPGGVFIYKDMTRRGVLRPLMNRLHDLLLARQWIHYADVGDVKRWMGEAGMTIVHEGFHARLWYGHELVVFRKAR